MFLHFIAILGHSSPPFSRTLYQYRDGKTNRNSPSATAEAWLSPDRFEAGSISILPDVGVSWSLVGTKKG